MRVVKVEKNICNLFSPVSFFCGLEDHWKPTVELGRSNSCNVMLIVCVCSVGFDSRTWTPTSVRTMDTLQKTPVATPGLSMWTSCFRSTFFLSMFVHCRVVEVSSNRIADSESVLIVSSGSGLPFGMRIPASKIDQNYDTKVLFFTYSSPVLLQPRSTKIESTSLS